ncbi:hypothetical protein FB451DRAFT_1408698 [Mycena latifolia]|nr:hypothetical protein FB451DRAFT_1408698 [Mycena latifolia]
MSSSSSTVSTSGAPGDMIYHQTGSGQTMLPSLSFYRRTGRPPLARARLTWPHPPSSHLPSAIPLPPRLPVPRLPPSVELDTRLGLAYPRDRPDPSKSPQDQHIWPRARPAPCAYTAHKSRWRSAGPLNFKGRPLWSILLPPRWSAPPPSFSLACNRPYGGAASRPALCACSAAPQPALRSQRRLLVPAPYFTALDLRTPGDAPPSSAWPVTSFSTTPSAVPVRCTLPLAARQRALAVSTGLPASHSRRPLRSPPRSHSAASRFLFSFALTPLRFTLQASSFLLDEQRVERETG